jgi:pyruvate/2-oxoglutarate dehydrogenase complex dihydrolipoamide dehydrogenase (E3) component
MTKNKFDLIVIGGGSAGYASARTAHGLGKTVAIVDGAIELGGLCILRGCMPSKTLIYSGEILWHARHGKEFGLNIPVASVDMAALHERKKRIIAEFAEYREKQLLSDRFTLFRAYAKFTSPNEIVLSTGETLTAEKFVISTGSTVNTPNIPGLKETRHWTSDDILDLETLPESIIVLGGGVIALELAQLMHRLGSKVTICQRNEFLVKEYSEAVSLEIRKALENEGINIHTGCQFNNISAIESGVQVEITTNNVEHTITAKHLLNAMGRKPNVDSLNLEAAQIKTKKSGHIDSNKDQQTHNPNVYACGDCAGPHEIVHVAIKQGEHAAKHAFGADSKSVTYENLLTVIFTDPQIASVGLCEKNLKEQNIEFTDASYPFNDHGKSILMNAMHGYVRVYATQDGTIVGAECVGKDAGELIHAMSVAVTLKANVIQLLKANWYHPTLSEIWEYPLEEIAESLDLL